MTVPVPTRIRPSKPDEHDLRSNFPEFVTSLQDF
jgi:hypothetical protein